MITFTLFLILLAVCNALYIVGLHKAAEYELYKDDTGRDINPAILGYDADNSMILGRLHYFCFRWFGLNWCKPLFSCVPCMASVHSLYIFWGALLFLFSFQPLMVLLYVVYIPVVSALAQVAQRLAI